MSQTPPPAEQPGQQQVPGIAAQVQFLPVPVQMQIERIDLGGLPRVLVLMRGPNAAMSGMFTLEEAKQLADMIASKASGVDIAPANALDNLPLDRILGRRETNGQN